MKIRKLVFAVLSMAMFILAGCGGSSGSSSTADSSASVKDVTVTTTLEMDGAKSKARSASDTTVTITTSGGTVYTMTPTGVADEYSCTIKYQQGSPLYIQAQVGNVALKNLITSVSGTTANVGSTNPTTTLMVDVIKTMAEEVDSGIDDSTFVSALLAGIEDKTFRVDVQTVMTQITDNPDNNATITALKETYTSKLTWTTAASTDEAVIAGMSAGMSAVQTAVQTNAITIPASSDATQELETAIANISVQASSGDYSGLLKLMYTEGVIMWGNNYANSVAMFTGSNDDNNDDATIPAGTTLNMISNQPVAVKLGSSSDVYQRLSKYGTEIYRVYLADHYQAINSTGSPVLEYAEDEQKAQDSGIIMQKINGKWYFMGDQDRAEYWVDYSQGTDGTNFYRSANFEVCEHDYPISNVRITSDAFSDVLYPEINTDTTDGNYGCYIGSFNYSGYYTTGGPEAQLNMAGGITNLAGQTLTIKTTFKDGSTEIRTKNIPAFDSSKAVTVTAVKQTDGSVRVAYQGFNDSTLANIGIRLNTDSGDVEASFLPFASSGSYTFKKEYFGSGKSYNFGVTYMDLYGRGYYGSASLTY